MSIAMDNKVREMEAQIARLQADLEQALARISALESKKTLSLPKK